jgi:glycosyltransferase involved in cell wall biosynthesis
MLSICIPVYNTNIVPLVNSLHWQCTKCKIVFEIICIDDASLASYKEANKFIQTYKEIKYSELSQNVGRAVIRNLLAEQANYAYLLLLDCDVAVSNSGFIQKYLASIHSSFPVTVGGRIYEQNSFNKKTGLHFNYGNKREVIPTETRMLNPYSSFVTGNFLIQKKIFDIIKFSSSLTEYGHEDTLFGLELERLNIPILHINNPVVHIGLETNETFIQKQLTAVKNLSALIIQGQDLSSISLYRFYLHLKKYRILGLFVFCFGLIQPLVKKMLQSGWTAWLTLFDALRLYELAGFLKEPSKKLK